MKARFTFFGWRRSLSRFWLCFALSCLTVLGVGHFSTSWAQTKPIPNQPRPVQPRPVQPRPAQPKPSQSRLFKKRPPAPKPTPSPKPEVPPTPSVPRMVMKPQEIRGVWMTLNDLDVLKDRRKVQEATTQLSQMNFNSVYPVVWNSGYVMYPSAIAQRQGIQPFVYRGSDGHDILQDLVTQAHRQNLMVMPWFEFGFMAPPTSELVVNHPDWITEQQNGAQTSVSGAGEVVWLNPFRPEVQRFITSLVVEVMSQYDVDGIQFDDNMSLPREFGYDDYTKALYQRETRRSVPGPTDPAWMKWRADKITAFMAQLKQAVRTVKPKAIFSISPNYYDMAYKLSLQDWLAWVRQGIADELIMQVYRSDLQSFMGQISRSEVQETQQRIPTGVGILSGLRTNPVSIAQIQSQVRAARDRGLGISFFYYESLWDESPEPKATRMSGFQSLFPYPAARSAPELVQPTIQAQPPLVPTTQPMIIPGSNPMSVPVSNPVSNPVLNPVLNPMPMPSP